MPQFLSEPVRVRVPATSANLGPGFDCAGLCLSLHDDVVVRVADAGLAVDIAGEGEDTLPRNRRHLVVASLHAAFDRLGGQPRGLEVACANRIPQARGLGSSSAAIVAAVLAARALVQGGPELLDDDAVLRLADELEGHPDNVAACLRGGFTVAWSDGAGARVVRRDAAPELLPVAFVPTLRSSTKQVRGLLPDVVPHAEAAANAAVPTLRSSTKQVRGLLPDVVPHAEAAANAARAALLALAVTAEPDLLLPATQDWLHQAYRASAMPRTAGLVTALRSDGVPAVVSGAGPTVLALCTRDTAPALLEQAPPGWTVRALPVDPQGAVLLPL